MAYVATAYRVVALIAKAYIVKAYVSVAYIAMAYTVMACTVVAYIARACMVMAYTAVASVAMALLTPLTRGADGRCNRGHAPSLGTQSQGTQMVLWPCMRACRRARARASVHECVRACVRACVSVCVNAVQCRAWRWRWRWRTTEEPSLGFTGADGTCIGAGAGLNRRTAENL